MSLRRVCTELVGIQGWEIEPDGMAIEEDAVILRIRRKPGRGFRCSRCGEGLLFAYEHREPRRVRDFPWAGKPCFLEASFARVDCPDCGVVLEGLDWIDPWARQTVRYEKFVASLCDVLPVTEVCEFTGLNKNAVYRMDRKWLEWREKQREQKPVKLLGIDEIALKKGHRYATVFYDLERREVIGLVRSRRERAVGGFFRRWGKKACRELVAVCMDLWSPYLNSVRRHCKHAAVVFDKFHVYRYFSEAIDAVRRHEQGRVSDAEGKLIKGTRWLWLKSSTNLKRKEKQTLREIMAVNRRLARAYVLKEDFEEFYECEDAAEARRFFQDWVQRAQRSRLEPFQRLAKRLKRWIDGILSYFEYRITNGVAEGINNKIKVLKRRCYGFHDEHYFFLKILQQCGALPPLDAVNHPHF